MSSRIAGRAYRAYLFEKADKKVVVCRPDAVASAIVRGVAEAVKAYFEKIFVCTVGHVFVQACSVHTVYNHGAAQIQ